MHRAFATVTENDVIDLHQRAAKIGHVLVPERRQPHWWDKWVNPTTVLALVGGIIWGIQLNSIVVQHTGQIAALQTQQATTITIDNEQNEQLTRITTILSGLVTRMEEFQDDVTDHNDEAESWKRKIEVNTHRLKQIEQRLPVGGQ